MDRPQATAFFSWQSDSPGNTNTNLIRRAIQAACDLQVEDSVRIDEATKGVAGSPDIPDTIFRKIRESAVGVFDLTIVGTGFEPLERKEPDRRRALPNPNVLLELGYAASAIGWKRVITVFNSDSGHEPEELPFDLRHRRFPIAYSTREGTTKAEKLLSRELSNRIELCLSAPHEQARIMRSRLDHNILVALDNIGLVECFHHGTGQVSIESVRRMLELNMIWCDQQPEDNLYAYHFTYVGDLVRTELYNERHR